MSKCDLDLGTIGNVFQNTIIEDIAMTLGQDDDQFQFPAIPPNVAPIGNASALEKALTKISGMYSYMKRDSLFMMMLESSGDYPKINRLINGHGIIDKHMGNSYYHRFPGEESGALFEGFIWGNPNDEKASKDFLEIKDVGGVEGLFRGSFVEDILSVLAEGKFDRINVKLPENLQIIREMTDAEKACSTVIERYVKKIKAYSFSDQNAKVREGLFLLTSFHLTSFVMWELVIQNAILGELVINNDWKVCIVN
ncbi:hypothetical protein ACFL08_00540 [Patescibacteria group bacterium]